MNDRYATNFYRLFCCQCQDECTHSHQHIDGGVVCLPCWLDMKDAEENQELEDDCDE